MFKNVSKSLLVGTALSLMCLTGCSSSQDQTGTVIMNTAINTDPALTDSSLNLVKKWNLIKGDYYELTGTLTYLPQYKDRVADFMKADLKAISKTLDATVDGKSLTISVVGTAGSGNVSVGKAVLGKDAGSISLKDLENAP